MDEHNENVCVWSYRSKEEETKSCGEGKVGGC